MNCFHYPVPNSLDLRQLLKNLPDSTSRPSGNGKLSCREILTPAVRRLAEPGEGRNFVEHCAAMIQSILNHLSDDERVQRSLGEYYGLRLLVTEFGSALNDFRESLDTSRLQRVARKLLRELNQPSSSGAATGSGQFATPELARAAG